jgi:hypothetical protein
VHPPTTYNYSFGIQQDLGFKTMLDVAYVGSVSRHLQQIRSINATPYGTNFLPSSMDQTIAGGATPLPAAFLRPYRGFADISINGFGANANYNSTQTQVNRRFRQDFIFGVAWTWSKVMDITDTNVAVNPFLDTHWRNYGKALFDQTHTFVANFSYNFPKVSRLWNNRFARTAFDDWELFGIASFLSGMPNGITYSLVSGADITGATGAGVDTRVVLTGNPVLPKSQQTDLRAFNTDVVTQPSFADFGRGTAPKDVFRGPGNNDWDLTLVKTFPFGKKEARHLDFKVEAYNAFNHTQFSAVSTAARFDATGKQVNTIFGQYTLARDSRRLQLALKFYF